METPIHILDWHALAPGLTSAALWDSWAGGGRPADETLPPFARIPPLMRRRMSTLSKLGVEVALSLAERHACDYGIFVSRHGELRRTWTLLEQITGNEPMSPTDFSHAVHNTASGLFTIAAHHRLPVSSIAARRDGFHQGMLDAIAQLYGGYAQRVLFVCFDDLPPPVYMPYVDEQALCYALGLVIEKGTSWVLNSDQLDAPPNLDEPQALQFLRALLLGRKRFSIAGSRQRWRWESPN